MHQNVLSETIVNHFSSLYVFTHIWHCVCNWKKSCMSIIVRREKYISFRTYAQSLLWNKFKPNRKKWQQLIISLLSIGRLQKVTVNSAICVNLRLHYKVRGVLVYQCSLVSNDHYISYMDRSSKYLIYRNLVLEQVGFNFTSWLAKMDVLIVSHVTINKLFTL